MNLFRSLSRFRIPSPPLSVGLLFFTAAFLAPLHARIDLLLVPPLDPVPGSAGIAFTLHLNNPTAFDETVALPREIEAEYASSAGHGHVTVVLANPHDARREVLAMSRVTVELRLAEPIPADARSFVSLRLTHPLSNAIMFEIDPAAPLPPPPPLDVPSPAPPPEPRSPITPDHHLDLTTDLENTRRHIFAYDPIYFAVGSRGRLNARFQFSFKYRVFETAAPGAPLLEQLVRDLHFAYTQVSIWDLETLSKPFYDSSYKPTVFLLHEFRGAPRGWLLALQAGAQHESNGRGSGTTTPGQRRPFDSRSLNSFYLLTRVRWTDATGLFAEATARASTFFDLEDNPDIARYRGYVELSLRGGYDRGFQLALHLRGHPSGHGSAEFNATWPAVETPILKMILPPSLGGYAQIQYFNGYGESLLDYDVRRKDQLRFGLMIVR